MVHHPVRTMCGTRVIIAGMDAAMRGFQGTMWSLPGGTHDGFPTIGSGAVADGCSWKGIGAAPPPPCGQVMCEFNRTSHLLTTQHFFRSRKSGKQKTCSP